MSLQASAFYNMSPEYPEWRTVVKKLTQIAESVLPRTFPRASHHLAEMRIKTRPMSVANGQCFDRTSWKDHPGHPHGWLSSPASVNTSGSTFNRAAFSMGGLPSMLFLEAAAGQILFWVVDELWSQSQNWHSWSRQGHKMSESENCVYHDILMYPQMAVLILRGAMMINTWIYIRMPYFQTNPNYFYEFAGNYLCPVLQNIVTALMQFYSKSFSTLDGREDPLSLKLVMHWCTNSRRLSKLINWIFKHIYSNNLQVKLPSNAHVYFIYGYLQRWKPLSFNLSMIGQIEPGLVEPNNFQTPQVRSTCCIAKHVACWCIQNISEHPLSSCWAVPSFGQTPIPFITLI